VLTDAQIAAARYEGSPEHKSVRWWGGLPGASVGPDGQASRPKKQKTTICPLTARAEQETATLWVREALRQRRFRFYEADQVYPNHVWHQDESGRI